MGVATKRKVGLKREDGTNLSSMGKGELESRLEELLDVRSSNVLLLLDLNNSEDLFVSERDKDVGGEVSLSSWKTTNAKRARKR